MNPNYKVTRTCGKSCGQKLRNRARGLGVVARTCERCGTGFSTMTSNPRRFCTRSCAKMSDFERPEFRALIHNERVRAKAQAGIRRFFASADSIQSRIATSLRMQAASPFKDPRVIARAMATKQKNGTLHVWLGKRGGNGHYTRQQTALRVALGPKWIRECPISLGRRRQGYPTCYKVDLGRPRIKLAIDLDGPGHASKRAFEKAIKKTQALSELGWRVLRFTNKDVTTRLSWVLSKIRIAAAAT